MLKITQDQFAALNAQSEKTYLERLLRLLRECDPDAAGVPDAELRTAVGEEIDKARGFGLRNEDEIAVFVLTAWQLGRDFDSFFPAAAFVLNSPDYSGPDKRDWLEQWTMAMFNELQAGD